MTDVTAGPVLPGPGGSGDAAPRRCKRPGCGNLVPPPGRGRTRLFCGDVCSRRFHNAARSAGGEGAVSSEQASDPIAALEALIGQAGSLIALARGQAAALDPETVAVQLADAEAARCRAEARAVTAEAQAAEAGQELLAAWEAARAAGHGREAAEAEASRACEAAGQARRELAEAVARAHAEVEAAHVHAEQRIAEAAGAAQTARAERDQAGEHAASLVRATEAELARARQAETDACDQVRQARDDAVREREALAEQYRARLQASEQLAAAERARAVRAEQHLDTEREQYHRLLTALTSATGQEDPAARASAPAPARRPRARIATARDMP